MNTEQKTVGYAKKIEQLVQERDAMMTQAADYLRAADKLAAENKVLRDALNNCEDALMNSQALIGSHRVGFEKTCF